MFVGSHQAKLGQVNSGIFAMDTYECLVWQYGVPSISGMTCLLQHAASSPSATFLAYLGCTQNLKL